MLSLGPRAPILRRSAIGSLAGGSATLYVANHGPAFGVPVAWVQYPSIPGTVGTFAIGFGLAALLLLAVTANLDRAHAIAFAVATACFVATIASEFLLTSRDRMGVASGAFFAAAIVALVWPEPKARALSILGGALSVAYSLAITFEVQTYDSSGVPMGPGIAWLHPVGKAVSAIAPLAAIAALLLATWERAPTRA